MIASEIRVIAYAYYDTKTIFIFDPSLPIRGSNLWSQALEVYINTIR